MNDKELSIFFMAENDGGILLAGEDLSSRRVMEEIIRAEQESWSALVLLRIRTKGHVAISEELEILGGDKETGLTLEAYCVGGVTPEYIQGFMRTNSVPSRISQVLLSFSAIESIEVCPITELGALAKMKEFYTAAEIAMAMGVSEEEIEARASEEDWPGQEHTLQ